MVQHHPDPYAVLGVTAAASQAQITQAYRAQVRALHPDTRPASLQNTVVAETQLRGVVAAYAQLRHLDRTSTRHSRPSEVSTESPHTTTSVRAVPIPVTRSGAHTLTPPSQRPLLWAGPVRRHRTWVDGR
jgi:preprotein translocase subunit Sec63